MKQEPLNNEEQRLYDLLSVEFWTPWYVLKKAAESFKMATLANMMRKGAMEAMMYVQPARITDGMLENGTITLKVKPYYPKRMPDGIVASHGNAYPRIFRRIEIPVTAEEENIALKKRIRDLEAKLLKQEPITK